MDFIDDKAEKPVAIHKFIGRRPIAAFGNSDGDLQMLQWCTDREGPSFGMLIHHTDCGMLTFSDGDVKDQILADTGIRPPFALEAFPDLDDSPDPKTVFLKLRELRNSW